MSRESWATKIANQEYLIKVDLKKKRKLFKGIRQATYVLDIEYEA